MALILLLKHFYLYKINTLIHVLSAQLERNSRTEFVFSIPVDILITLYSEKTMLYVRMQ
jgi:hypothetical protein